MSKKTMSPSEMRIYNRLRHHIGNTMRFDGNVFGRKTLPETDFKCLDIKVFTQEFLNIDTMEPTANVGAKFLLKNEDMKKAMWTISFHMRLEEPTTKEGVSDVQ
jgi:hypothetical protein